MDLGVKLFFNKCYFNIDNDLFLIYLICQGVTLGGTGKETGDRHPKVGEGVLIGASATILGNITIGEGSMIAAGSLVLKEVPPHRYKLISSKQRLVLAASTFCFVLEGNASLIVYCFVLKHCGRNTSKCYWWST